MADGLRCKYCGWQETDHLVPEQGVEEEYRKVRPSYSLALYNCTGFELSVRGEAVARRIEARRQREEEIAGQCWINRAHNYESWFSGEWSF